MKKPTAVRAETATTSAATNKRNSPARASRRSMRKENRKKFISANGSGWLHALRVWFPSLRKDSNRFRVDPESRDYLPLSQYANFPPPGSVPPFTNPPASHTRVLALRILILTVGRKSAWIFALRPALGGNPRDYWLSAHCMKKSLVSEETRLFRSNVGTACPTPIT